MVGFPPFTLQSSLTLADRDMHVELFCLRISVYRPSYKKTRQNESHFALGGTAFPLEPRFSREETQKNKRRAPDTSEQKEGDALLCFAGLHGRTAPLRDFACTFPGTKRREKRVLGKGSLPFRFLLVAS